MSSLLHVVVCTLLCVACRVLRVVSCLSFVGCWLLVVVCLLLVGGYCCSLCGVG